jgi:predicted hotdog family 3-hydroxylacyl-ACP dehydratase
MNWLERVDSHTSEGTVCQARIPKMTPLSAADGTLPGFAAIELMAQCAAAHASLEVRRMAEEENAPGALDEPQTGSATGRMLLLGTRVLEIERSQFHAGEVLDVEVRPSSFASSGLAVMACSVRDAAGNEVSRARLNLFAQP